MCSNLIAIFHIFGLDAEIKTTSILIHAREDKNPTKSACISARIKVRLRKKRMKFYDALR
jgi:hypothetical protein